MKIVAELLQNYLSEKLSVHEIVTALELAGIEVEDVLHPPQFDSLIVSAIIKEVHPHPDADRLQVVKVETKSDSHQVVCGAPNVKPGQIVAYAQVGAQLPDGTDIREKEIRGVKSLGMVCSEQELGLGSNHETIIDLGAETSPGLPLSEIFTPEQVIIEAKTAPNRWDLQSYLGIAYEVAAHTSAEVLKDKIVQSSVKAERVDSLFLNEVKEEVPCYSLIKINLPKGPGESPEWMQRFLRLQGLRPVNGVVDITNYVMITTGQPLHAFDAGKLNGDVVIRFASNQESMTAIDGAKRMLANDDLVIADKQGPIAIAGVMGGADSQVGSTTRDVLLEAATFDGSLVRKTAKRHGLRTEASIRFERNIPTQAVKQALRYAVSLINEHVGGDIKHYQNELNIWPWIQHIGVSSQRMQKLSGLEMSKDEIVENLSKLHFDVDEFDIAKEAKKHLGKPYKLGAKYKTDGVEAFDCSYLVDYIYSLIGRQVGHTALGQFELGEEVGVDELRPGDVVFYEGKIDESATDHYYTLNEDRTHTKHSLKETKKVGHNGIYIGDDTVVHASKYELVNGEWVERKEPGVIESKLSEFTNNPAYLGARRFVNNLDDLVRVTVPWWRPDVVSQEDILEEVVKLVGLNKVPSSLPKWNPRQVTPDKTWAKLESIRQLLYGLGLHEVTTYPFISEDDITTFNLKTKHLKLANPRSQEQSYLRTTTLPLLVRAVVNNTNYANNFGVFEMAKVFKPSDSELLPKEELKLGIAVKTGNVLEMKNYLDQLFEHFHFKPRVKTAKVVDFLHPSKGASLHIEEATIGHFGELHPDILNALKYENKIMYAEADIDALLACEGEVKFKAQPKFQSSYRDITVLAAKSLNWQDIEGTLLTVDDVVVSFVGEYHKGKDQKAITIHLELLARETTLTDKEINAKVSNITKLLQKEHGVKTDDGS